MDPASENTCEQNHREELSELASAHWQPVKDSSLVVKIAHGCGGAGEGAGWKKQRRACRSVWAPLVLHGQASGAPPQLFLPCHCVLEGEGKAKHRWS